MSVIVAAGLPETISFISVPPPPAVQPTQHAFDPVLTIPANLTNTKLSISASGSILLPGGSSGSGFFDVALFGKELQNPGIIGVGTAFGMDTSKVIPWNFVANVFCDPTANAIRDVQVPGNPFTGSSPQSGGVMGSDGGPASADYRAGSKPYSGINQYGNYGGIPPLDFTQPINLYVMVSVYNAVNNLSRPGDGTNSLPPISVTLTQFQLEY